jgi:cytochrome c2
MAPPGSVSMTSLLGLGPLAGLDYTLHLNQRPMKVMKVPATQPTAHSTSSRAGIPAVLHAASRSADPSIVLGPPRSFRHRIRSARNLAGLLQPAGLLQSAGVLQLAGVLLLAGLLLPSDSLLFAQVSDDPAAPVSPETSVAPVAPDDPAASPASDSVAASPATHPLIAGWERFHADSPKASRRAGTLLATELGCTACHQSDNPHWTPKSGPDLTGLRQRIDVDWVRQFLANPHQAKPGTTMPDLLAGEPASRRLEKVEALTHYLASLPGNPEHFQLNRPPLEIVHPQFWDRGDIAAGQELFHRVGCVACHAPDSSFAGAASTYPDAERQLRELGLDDEEIQELLEDSLPDTAPIVPFPSLHRKYLARSLSFFLLQPLITRPSARMPDFGLTPAESADLAAYLQRRSEAEEQEREKHEEREKRGERQGEKHEEQQETRIRDWESPDPELVDSGRSLFQSLGCIHCHVVPDVQPNRDVPSWEGLAERPRNGCLADRPPSGTADFGLSQSQRTALRSLLEGAPSSVEELPEATRDPFILNLTLEQHNCLACHRRDQRGGVGADRWRFFETIDHIDLGDEGRIPPALDRVGWKLTTSWLKEVLTEGQSVRPHMLARMPRFGRQPGESLSRLLESVDQAGRPAGRQADRSSTKPSAESSTEPSTNNGRTERRREGDEAKQERAASQAVAKPEREVPRGDVESGRLLLDVGCIQCHPIRGEQLPGVVGIDLNLVSGRLRQDWFFAFLKDPATLKPGTRMPTFFPGGISNSPEIADGDVNRQIASLWEYLHATDTPPLPDRLSAERLHNFELTPTDTPLVLRTFMEEVGTHAIAVGFPGQLALAYDAWNLRPAIAWKGRFLDAHPIWFDRFAPPTPPLGEQRIDFPRIPLLARLESEQAPWPPAAPPSDPRAWQGFRLDESGVPTFRHRWKRYLIEDRFAPLSSGDGLRRTIRVRLTDTRQVSERKEEHRGSPTSRPSDQDLWICLHAGPGLERDGSQVKDAQGLNVKLRTTGGEADVSRVRAMERANDEAASAPQPAQWIMPLRAAARIAAEHQPPDPQADTANEPVRHRDYLIELEYRW